MRMQQYHQALPRAPLQLPLTGHLAHEGERLVAAVVGPAPGQWIAKGLGVVGAAAVLGRQLVVVGLWVVARHVAPPVLVRAAVGPGAAVRPAKGGPQLGLEAHPVEAVVAGQQQAGADVVALHLGLLLEAGEGDQVAAVVTARLLGVLPVRGGGVVDEGVAAGGVVVVGLACQAPANEDVGVAALRVGPAVGGRDAIRLAVVCHHAVLRRHQVVGLGQAPGLVGAPVLVVAAAGSGQGAVHPAHARLALALDAHPVGPVVAGDEVAQLRVGALNLCLLVVAEVHCQVAALRLAGGLGRRLGAPVEVELEHVAGDVGGELRRLGAAGAHDLAHVGVAAAAVGVGPAPGVALHLAVVGHHAQLRPLHVVGLNHAVQVAPVVVHAWVEGARRLVDPAKAGPAGGLQAKPVALVHLGQQLAGADKVRLHLLLLLQRLEADSKAAVLLAGQRGSALRDGCVVEDVGGIAGPGGVVEGAQRLRLANVGELGGALGVGPGPGAVKALCEVGASAVLGREDVVGLQDVLRHEVAPVLVAALRARQAIQPAELGPGAGVEAHPVEGVEPRQQCACRRAGSRRGTGWLGGAPGSWCQRSAGLPCSHSHSRQHQLATHPGRRSTPQPPAAPSGSHS
jgi:hypothetical protein